jgi:excisionase family DNA binding protein
MQTIDLEMTKDLSDAFFNPRASSLFRKVSSVRTRFLATRDAAEYLGVSVWTLRSYVHDGRLEYIPGGKWRFDREDLDRFLVASKERGQAL